jgi:hypothetical protein
MNNILHHENSEVISHTNLYSIMCCTYANKRFALLLGADKRGYKIVHKQVTSQKVTFKPSPWEKLAAAKCTSTNN